MTSRYQRCEGIALLSTMILLLAVSSVLATIFYRHQLATGMAARALHGDQATLLALSAESWVTDLLSDRQDNRASDHLDENWAQPLPPLPLEGGELRGCLHDLQAKININNFSLPAEQRPALLVATWQQLLEESSATRQQQTPAVAAVIDWLDADDQPHADGGREYYPYHDGIAERLPPNRAVSDVEELAAVEGFDIGLSQLAQRFSSALPQPTAVNINTAAPALLAALARANNGNQPDQPLVDWLQAQRPFASMEAFYRALATSSNQDQATVAARWPASVVTVASDYFELIADIRLGTVQLEYRALLDRRDRARPVVVARQLQWVPAIAPPSSDEQRLRQQRELAPACQVTTGQLS